MDHSYFLLSHLTSNVSRSGAMDFVSRSRSLHFSDVWEVGCGSVEETLKRSVWKEVLLRKEDGEVLPPIS